MQHPKKRTNRNHSKPQSNPETQHKQIEAVAQHNFSPKSAQGQTRARFMHAPANDHRAPRARAAPTPRRPTAPHNPANRCLQGRQFLMEETTKLHCRKRKTAVQETKTALQFFVPNGTRSTQKLQTTPANGVVEVKTAVQEKKTALQRMPSQHVCASFANTFSTRPAHHGHGTTTLARASPPTPAQASPPTPSEPRPVRSRTT